MRLFSALSVPDDVAQALVRFRGGLPPARWIDPPDYHVTLAFFGEIDRPVAEDLAQALSEIVAAPLELHVRDLAVFGADKPRAIVALIEKTPALAALETAHRAAMRRSGVTDQARKYTPHVTLARLRRTPAGEIADWMSRQPVSPALSWQADSFAIYSSRTSRGGGPYLADVTFTLSGSAPSRDTL